MINTKLLPRDASDPLPEAQQRLLDLMRSKPRYARMTFCSLADELGLTCNAVRGTLNRLRSKRLVTWEPKKVGTLRVVRGFVIAGEAGR